MDLLGRREKEGKKKKFYLCDKTFNVPANCGRESIDDESREKLSVGERASHFCKSNLRDRVLYATVESFGFSG